MSSALIMRVCSRATCASLARNCTRLASNKAAPTAKLSQPAKKDSWFTRQYKKWMETTSEQQLKTAGYLLSPQCTQAVSARSFFEYFDMPDTYFSWFLVSELHIWLVSNRIMVNKTTDGIALRNYLIEAFWLDCHSRSKLLADMPGSERKEAIKDIAEEFRAYIMVYDYGALGDDKELANALWRRFFILGQPDGPRLELLVKYVRQTLAMLDEVPLSDILAGKPIKWIPLDVVNSSR